MGVVGFQSHPLRLRPGDSGFVNADRPGINAHNSPSAAVYYGPPGVIAVADRIDTPRFSCSVSMSTNGGASWKQLPLPLPTEAPNCHQPDVAFDATNHLLVLYTATGGRFNQPVGVWLQRFDGETPAGAAVRVAPAEAFHARMAVEGRQVWVSWVQADGAAEKPLGFTAPGSLRLARSTDGGATFAPPTTVGSGRRVVQPTPVSLGDGRLLVGALDLADDVADYEATHGGVGGPPSQTPWRVVAWTSGDAGATFTGPVAVAADLAPPERIIVNLAPAPSFARDPISDRGVYAAWDAGRGDQREVYLAHSGDDGGAWSAPVAVAPRRGGQYLPAVGVSPLGRVDVVFYDRGADPGDRRAQVTMASSTDEGRTFRTATISPGAFDSRIGFGSLQGIPLLGSRLAVVSGVDRTVAFWADTSRGTIDDNVQDLAFVEVGIEPATARRPLLLTVGLLLLGVGGGLGFGGRFGGGHGGSRGLLARFRPGRRRPQEA